MVDDLVLLVVVGGVSKRRMEISDPHAFFSDSLLGVNAPNHLIALQNYLWDGCIYFWRFWGNYALNDVVLAKTSGRDSMFLVYTHLLSMLQAAKYMYVMREIVCGQRVYWIWMIER